MSSIEQQLKGEFRRQELLERQNRRFALIQRVQRELDLYMEDLTPEDQATHNAAIRGLSMAEEAYRQELRRAWGYWHRLWFAIWDF